MTDPTREAVDLTHLAASLARDLFSAAATHPGPLYQRLSQRMMRPEVGDLVVETSSLCGFDPDGVGHLLAVEGDNPQYPDIYVVEPLHRPGEQVRWGNATFLAVPTDRAERWLARELLATLDSGATDASPELLTAEHVRDPHATFALVEDPVEDDPECE